ncbi:MAG: hypothetical protein K0Q90_506 [Paenibacillaceae bacterium]|jgi:hypothetical protein|nr:hypothetical protein [Paenibacillaceae bacterium]
MLAPIYFQFSDKKAALLALDTLQELGFTGQMLEHRHPEHKPVLALTIRQGDLVAALEIAQAHGGVLLETADQPEQEVYTNAYGLGGISIPAHTVTEDLPEAYLAGEESASLPRYKRREDTLAEEEALVAENAAQQFRDPGPGLFDPSGDDLDQFNAGVHL